MAHNTSSPDASSAPPKVGTYAGLALVTLSTLMLEIALTRIFSVTMWYHFAFVAISVALFGMTAGALLVHLLPRRFPTEDVSRQLWTYSLGFGLAVVLCFAIQLNIPFTPKVLHVLKTLTWASLPAISHSMAGASVCLLCVCVFVYERVCAHTVR